MIFSALVLSALFSNYHPFGIDIDDSLFFI